MNLVECVNSEEWIRQSVAKMSGILEQALESRGRAVMIAAGGTTPADIYGALGRIDLDWSAVTIIPSDERWVNETSNRSNLSMIKRALTRDNPANGASFQPLFMSGSSPEEAAPRLSQQVSQHVPADLCVLGMGNDRHTASLFPGMGGLKTAMADDAPVVVPASMPVTGESRVTLTLATLRQSQCVMLLIRGRNKRVALQVADETANGLKSPVSPLLPQAHVYWSE
ncbi:MAG: 6-phosphogluconolactonase [Rhodobacteraceae bacterium]|nr:6-phosphogluconolactonase [Paracoccaceae bacterium]